jgi:ATP-dependent RNA helicase DeaD
MPAHSDAPSFSALGLRRELADIVAALGYEEPTPVQREAIPLLLQAKDLLGQAETGTGKTAAFALPMLQRIADSKANARATYGLVLVPTRELAMQVAEAVHKYAKGIGVSVLPVYGGAPMHHQVMALQRGANVVIATPGRALDHIRKKTLQLDNLRLLVLDEADEMLDMGFADDLDAILKATPENRQTALFSATMPARILAIAGKHLKNPARVTIAREKTAAGKIPRVRQMAYVVSRANKPAALARILDMEDPVATIVFCRTRMEVESLVETFNAHGHRSEALHGGMEQRQRDKVMGLFRTKKADVLIATDVAARGLDIEHLSHVVNYDVPASPDAYLHRIGRTGRAGRAGTAITLAEPREHRLLRAIENSMRAKIEIGAIPTVADLRARRLDLTRATLRERLLAGNDDHARVVVESLATEFDIVQIAAAAVAMAHAATTGDENSEREIPAAQPEKRSDAGERSGPRDRHRDASSPRLVKGTGARGAGARAREGDEHMVRLFVGAGRKAGIRPGDLVGAITGEAGVTSKSVGAIEIADAFSLVDVPGDLAESIIAALKATSIRGKKVPVRRDREG